MMCTILESLLNDFNGLGGTLEHSKIRKYICQSFIFSYLWSLGSNLIDSSQSKFESFVLEQFEEIPEASISSETELFNVYFNTMSKTFENWNNIVPNFVYNADIPYFELLVPTIDSIRYSYIIQRLLQMNQPVMLTGITGKSLLNAVKLRYIFF